MTNQGRLQALLYVHGGEMKKREVMSMLSISEEELASTVSSLKEFLEGQALELYETDVSLSLRTGKELSLIHI